MKTFLIDISGGNQLPDLQGTEKNISSNEFSDFRSPGKINRHFYRELAEHFQMIGRVSMIDFCISNSGSEPAHDVRLEIHIEDPDDKLFIQEAFEIPHRPEKDRGLSNLKPILLTWNAGVKIRRNNRVWLIEIKFGRIMPGHTAFSTNAVYMGARTSLSLDMHVGLFTGNSSHPLPMPLTIDIQPQKRTLERDIICT